MCKWYGSIDDDDIDYIFGDSDPIENSREYDQWSAEYLEGIDFDPETGLYYEEQDIDEVEEFFMIPPRISEV